MLQCSNCTRNFAKIFFGFRFKKMTGHRLENSISNVQIRVYRVEEESLLKILGVGGRVWAGALCVCAWVALVEFVNLMRFDNPRVIGHNVGMD
jgi:hypothetical protein